MSVSTQLSYEEIIQKHKKEQKELQGRILQLKKSISNNCKDKKKKKEILAEIESLKEGLKTKQDEELAAFQQQGNVEAEELCDGVNSLNVDEEDSSEAVQNGYSYTSSEGKKMSKAERRRRQKAIVSKKRESEIEESEKMAVNSARNIEVGKIRTILKERNLKEFQIAPDGNCMFSAVVHQSDEGTSISGLRAAVACYMEDNMNDFIDFMVSPSTGETMTTSQFRAYCASVRDTPAWGGHPELRAISHVLQKRIEVVQADCSPIIIGDEYQSNGTVTLGYYRHYYGLGEHYNSVVPLNDSDTEE